MTARDVCRIPGKQFCWMSGIQIKPTWWHAPWFMQAAHLGSGSGCMDRVDDIRMVVCLCPLLHDLHVVDTGRIASMTIGTHTLPTIDNSNMLWIKQRMDPEHFDMEFITQHWKKTPPEPRPPHKHWLKSMRDTQGILWKL